MKKFSIFIGVIIFIIFIYAYMSNLPKDYEKKYELEGMNITEKYNNKEKYYSFNVNSNDKNFYFVLDKAYSTKRGIIDSITVYDKDDTYCININIIDEMIIPQCYEDDELVDPYLSSWDNYKYLENKVLQNKDNVDIYNNDLNYLLWNSYGYTNVLTENKIKVVSKESYTNDLAYKMDNYLLTANYDSNRSFNSIFIYDYDNNKMKTLEFDYDISFNSYFMGDYDGYVYLLDLKNLVEYKINPEKNKISIISSEDGGTYYDDGWQEVPLNQIVKEKYMFIKDSLYNYFLEDNKLYLSFKGSDLKIKISNKEVNSIITIKDDTVYYLVNDTLYMYNQYKGEIKLLSYFEWNFSYNNKIFIFD